MALAANDVIIVQRNDTNTLNSEKILLGTGMTVDHALGFDVSKNISLVKFIRHDKATSAGDILYFDGSTYHRLAVGSPGQVLTVNGGGNAPAWNNLAAGHEQNTDIGTSSGSFYIGGQLASNILVKNNAGEFQVRLGNDSDYANFRCKNLIVEGTTTTVNSETVTMADNVVVLNSNYSGSGPAENGGFEIERGTLTNASLIWDETADLWKAGLAGSEVAISLVGHTHTKSQITDFAHNLLSASHTDTTAGTVTRGAIIAGMGASPSWSTLVAGTSGMFLKTLGAAADPAWASIGISDVTDLQNQLNGKSGTSHVHDASAITTGTLALARGGTNNAGTYTNGKLLKFDSGSGAIVSDPNVYIQCVAAPASNVAAGTAGQFAYDGDFIYVCTATNTWRRCAIGSWS